jgi:inner membrane protein
MARWCSPFPNDRFRTAPGLDNLCHTLVGVTLAQAGFKSRTGRAVLTGAIAANLPDLDALVFLTDIPAVAFRRGITHGVPAQVLLPVALAAVLTALGGRRRFDARPVHFGWLLVLSYLGVLTHVYMDLLNTYGVRLLSPLSQRWFYGDAVFIIDPVLWIVLGAGAWLARRRGSRLAQVAVLVACLYIGAMVASARAARAIVHDAWVARAGAPPQALMVGPAPFSLHRKTVIVDAGDHYVEGSFRWVPATVTFSDVGTAKNEHAPGVAEARQDADVAGLLVWSRFPFWTVEETPEGRRVTVGDMRFKDGPGRGSFRVTVDTSNVEGRTSKER